MLRESGGRGQKLKKELEHCILPFGRLELPLLQRRNFSWAGNVVAILSIWKTITHLAPSIPLSFHTNFPFASMAKTVDSLDIFSLPLPLFPFSHSKVDRRLFLNRIPPCREALSLSPFPYPTCRSTFDIAFVLKQQRGSRHRLTLAWLAG